MRKALQVAATCLLMGMFLSPTLAMAGPNENANDNAFEATGKHSVPEIRTVAASAVGILVVGGIALLTTRRRTRVAKI